MVVPDDLAASVIGVGRTSHDVGNVFRSQRFLGFARHAGFRNGVDTGRHDLGRCFFPVNVERNTNRQARLFHAGGGDKTGGAMKRLDLVRVQLLFPALAIVSHDIVLVMHEVLHGRFAPERKIDPEEFARTPTRKRERRFAQRLARHRAGVDARTPDPGPLFHQRHALPENGGGVGSANAGRSATDDYQIKRWNWHGEWSQMVSGCAR